MQILATLPVHWDLLLPTQSPHLPGHPAHHQVAVVVDHLVAVAVVVAVAVGKQSILSQRLTLVYCY
jgi:hypothetical protein